MKRHGNTRRRANELVELVCIDVCCYFGAVKSQAKLAKKSSIKIKSSKLDVEVRWPEFMGGGKKLRKLFSHIRLLPFFKQISNLPYSETMHIFHLTRNVKHSARLADVSKQKRSNSTKS